MNQPQRLLTPTASFQARKHSNQVLRTSTSLPNLVPDTGKMTGKKDLWSSIWSA
jgi:hypothetical protein